MAGKYKLKTHKGAAKRFRKTANGVKCRSPFRNHILTKKAQKAKRQRRDQMAVHPSDVAAVERMLAGS